MHKKFEMPTMHENAKKILLNMPKPKWNEKTQKWEGIRTSYVLTPARKDSCHTYRLIFIGFLLGIPFWAIALFIAIILQP